MRIVVYLLEQILSQLKRKPFNLDQILVKLDAIIELLSPPKAVSFRISFTPSGDFMAFKPKATLDFTIFENGQATASLTPVDSSGNATTMPTGASIPTYTCTDSSVVLSASADGLSCLVTAGKVAVTAATITATSTLADGTTTLTGTSDPFDVVPQPPGSAVAFKIVLS